MGITWNQFHKKNSSRSNTEFLGLRFKSEKVEDDSRNIYSGEKIGQKPIHNVTAILHRTCPKLIEKNSAIKVVILESMIAEKAR